MYPNRLNTESEPKGFMASSYLNNGEALYKCMIDKVKEEISEPNLSYVLEYAKHMRIDGKNYRTIARHLRELRFIFNELGSKDAKKCTEAEIKNVVLAVNNSNKAPISKFKILLTLRVFWRYLYGSAENPDVVKFVKPKHASGTLKTSQELLSLDEIKKLVEAGDTQLEKTLVMLFACSGARVGEVLNLKISSLQLATQPNTLSFCNFEGKTGKRITPLLSEAVPFLQDYLNTERKGAKGEEPLFVYKETALDFKNVRHILKKLSEKANISKRVHSHLFRYSLSSYVASKGMQESQMALFFGYSSNMASHYTKLSNVNEVIAKMNGIETKEKAINRNLLNPKMCSKCGTLNDFTNKLCKKCLVELDQNVDEKVKGLETELYELKSAVNMLIGKLDTETKNKIMAMLNKS